MTKFDTSLFAIIASLSVVASTPSISQTMTVAAHDGSSQQQENSNSVYRSIVVSADDMYELRVPSFSNFRVRLNNELIMDSTRPTLKDAGNTVTVVTFLRAGEHVLEFEGIAADHHAWPDISLSAGDAEPQPILDATKASVAGAWNAPTSSPEPQTQVMTSEPAESQPYAGPKPFQIGGTSSRANLLDGIGSNLELPNGDKPSETPEAEEQPTTPPMGNVTVATGPSRINRTTQQISSDALDGIGSSMPEPPAPEPEPQPPAPEPEPQPPAPQPEPKPPAPQPEPPAPAPAPEPKPEPPAPKPEPPAPAPEPEPEPPAPPTDETRLSPLIPPASVAITEAVQLTASGNANGEVPMTGATLFGAVKDPGDYDTVEVKIDPVGRVTTVDVGPKTGQFAVRLFPEDFADGIEIKVSLTGASSSMEDTKTDPVSYDLKGVLVGDGLTQALGRLSFGASPQLYARVRASGYKAYVEEQLNPASINNEAFMSTNPDSLLEPTIRSRNVMFNSIMAYEIAHAAYSEKQLQEVMGQFWINHFFATTKGSVIYQQNIPDRKFFRENAFGKFEDLLLYSARSPLMARFLDNVLSRAGNINENYAREILELSTVGTNAGYGPDDVIAVARVLTGWSYKWLNPNAVELDVAPEFEFLFASGNHDTKEKYIPFLDLTIEGKSGPAGVEEGEELIRVLAQHPSTRTHVCGKIVQLLVADDKPQHFIDVCAAAWEETQGDVRAMLRAILLDPAYLVTPQYQRNKGKTPFEYSVSAIRAFGARPSAGNEVDFYAAFRETFESAGQDMLRYPVPTGLPEVAAAWTNTATMSAAYSHMTSIAEERQDFGIDLQDDIKVAGLESAEEVASYLLAIATADRYTREEYEAVIKVLKGADGIFEPRSSDETEALERAMGLIIVTPSFQLQ